MSFLGTIQMWPGPHPPLPAMQQPRPQQAFVAQHNGIAEASWLHQLLHELHASLHRATLVYCDNINAVYMSSNPVQHQRTKHIEIDLQFVRE